jgi:uncharacterized protein (UPF0332 family)
MKTLLEEPIADMTRAEHLAWCKARALDYVETGYVDQAFYSFLSDMRKHEETKDHAALQLMTELFIAGHLNDARAMREFIEGFN